MPPFFTKFKDPPTPLCGAKQEEREGEQRVESREGRRDDRTRKEGGVGGNVHFPLKRTYADEHHEQGGRRRNRHLAIAGRTGRSKKEEASPGKKKRTP